MRGFKVSTGRRLGRTALLGLISLAAAFQANAWHHYQQLALSGTPVASDAAGTAYHFTPTASGTSGRTLTYTIFGMPIWAKFNTATGALTGTPAVANVGTYSNISIRVTNGISIAYLAPFSISVTNPQNATPVISGTPATAVNTGTGYTFTPSASDAIGAPLTFSILNRPAWANFNSLTGQLSGTPTSAYAGSYSNIVISVSDGVASASLPAFAINVVAVANGTATVSWTPPVANTNGSTITNLAGYRIHYGNSSSNLSQIVQVANVGLTSYTLSSLSSGTWYFAVSAYNSSGTESSLSNLSSKTIP